MTAFISSASVIADLSMCWVLFLPQDCMLHMPSYRHQPLSLCHQFDLYAVLFVDVNNISAVYCTT